MKHNDIYRWRYTEKVLKQMSDGNNGGTTYWCCSNIAIYDAEKDTLRDTYWHSGDGRLFKSVDVDDRIRIEFIANLDDLKPVEKYEFNNYDDADCIDISHANMMRDGFYIKKTAKPSISKKRRVLIAHIKYYQHKQSYYKRETKRLIELLKTLTVETHVPCDKDVYIG